MLRTRLGLQQWLMIVGLALTLLGACFGFWGVWVDEDQALEYGQMYLSGETRERNLQLPPVQNLLRQSQLAMVGFAFIGAGTVLQAVAVMLNTRRTSERKDILGTECHYVRATLHRLRSGSFHLVQSSFRACAWFMRLVVRRSAFLISLCNLVGLVFSVWGVLLLFNNVLPTPIQGSGTSLAGDDYNASLWQAEYDRHDKAAHRGLVLVLVGTALEAVPPFCTACTAIWSWRRRPVAPP